MKSEDENEDDEYLDIPYFIEYLIEYIKTNNNAYTIAKPIASNENIRQLTLEFTEVID